MTDSDFRKIGLVAIVMLVIVRLAIGWQLLYEGLWKLQSTKTSSPWSAEPYLKNAQGPLREYFRSLTGDPDDLRYLDYATVDKRWSEWQQDFATHYELDDRQQKTLQNIVHGSEYFARGLEQLPEGVELPKKEGRGLYYDAERKRLVVDGKLHMTPREKADALKQINFDAGVDDLDKITDPVARKYAEEILKIYEQQSRLSYKEQALATLMGNPENAGLVDDSQKGTIDEKRLGKIEIYRNRLKRYEEKLARTRTHFDQDHLDYDWKEIQQLRAELVGPIKGLESDMMWTAEKLLTTDQLARGPLPEEWSPQRDIDLKTMWGLTLIGGCLLAGFCTRIAALAGAFMIFNFYMAYPPLPGYPHPPGPEHSYVVNKNLLEVLMLFAFVFLPTGSWFGIDAIFSGIFLKKNKDDRS